jgi:hypothetical protein
VPMSSFSVGTITAGRITGKTEPGAEPLPLRR